MASRLLPFPSMVDLRTWPSLATHRDEPREPYDVEEPPAFITITRQPGASAWDLGYDLVNAINSTGSAGPAWACWDHELAQEVAADCHVPASIVENQAYAIHSWLDDMIEGMTFWPDPQHTDMTKIFHGLAELVHRLAQMGHVILVGHGARYLTRHLPGGRHVYLLAPRDRWARHIAERRNISLGEASKLLHELQHNRRAFQRRFLPGLDLSPEQFTMTLNTAALSQEQLVRCVMPLSWKTNMQVRADAGINV